MWDFTICWNFFWVLLMEHAVLCIPVINFDRNDLKRSVHVGIFWMVSFYGRDYLGIKYKPHSDPLIIKIVE